MPGAAGFSFDEPTLAPIARTVIAARPDDSDDDLLRMIGDGDQSAFRILVERHIDRAYALALRILGNSADADDVVQDTMLKVWALRGAWESGRAKFSTWLYRVVTNRCLDLRRQPRTEEMETASEVMDERPDPLSTIHRHEVSDLLRGAMARLPDHQRVALILSYFEDMSNGEIAEVLDTTVAAVESLLKRGRQHLRKKLSRSARDIRESFTND
ncbi:RNA polymerase sigma factor [Terrirubrum flagellatum]|uniref:RNA polymerase sigma factor n=1 Tax=Terrirubrum flagellatum TaxID=2895980 RepID=UPI003CC82130